MVIMDQFPWHELNVNDELTLQTQDKFCQRIEADLRRRLYRWNHMRVDYVVEPTIFVPMAVSGTDWGPTTQEDIAVGDQLNDIVGHIYYDQIQTEDDLEKFHLPKLVHDKEETAKRVATMREIFDGILAVETEGTIGILYGLNVWDILVMWHGVENTLIDLAERPEFIHKILVRAAAVQSSFIDQLEDLGLLNTLPSWINGSGMFTDELPAPGFDPAKLRAKDNWIFGMAQIFTSVSPAMLQEFDLDYFNPLYARFGLVYYGCCEPLHGKLDYVRKIPNLRKISMSPWVDVEVGAAGIGKDFVFSRKPNPAILATSQWDIKEVENDLRQTMNACKRYGCPLEFVLKDLCTVSYQPQRLWEWADMAMNLVQEYNC